MIEEAWRSGAVYRGKDGAGAIGLANHDI